MRKVPWREVAFMIVVGNEAFAQPYRFVPEHRRPDPSPLPIWDPGFGPHAQDPPPQEREARIREILSCEGTALVCCDPCGICVCERGMVRCPDIMLMSRRHCEKLP